MLQDRKVYEMSIVNWKPYQGPSVQAPLGSHCVGGKGAPFLREQGDLPHQGPVTCFRGDQRVLPAAVIFQIPLTSNIQ